MKNNSSFWNAYILFRESSSGLTVFTSVISGIPLTLPNVISQYLFFFFSFYIFLFVSLSTIYFYCRTTETPKHLQMMIISEKTIINPLYYYEYLYKNILIGEFHIDNEIIEVKDRTYYFIGNMY